MCQLLETIRYENGQFHNLERHTARLNRSRKMLFGKEDEIDLEKILLKKNPEPPEVSKQNDVYKCRIIYAKEIEKIEFIPYPLPVIRTLKIVTDNEIDYAYKFTDRSRLQQLYNQRGECDDILIVKNGLLTDTYFANILFYNGKNWVTPAHPLLKGTQRQYLLETNQIVLVDIRPSDLDNFQNVRLINAMIRFEDELDIKIEDIHF